MTIPLDKMTRQDMEDELKLRELLAHRQRDEARQRGAELADRFAKRLGQWWRLTKIISVISFALVIYVIWRLTHA